MMESLNRRQLVEMLLWYMYHHPCCSADSPGRLTFNLLAIEAKAAGWAMPYEE